MIRVSPLAGRLRLAAFLFALVLGFAAATTAGAQTTPQPLPQPLPKRQLNVGIHLMNVEVAADDATRTRGLMFRQQLGASDGMLFVFRNAQVQCFWMRNTFIALSVAFLDDQGAIVNIADMKPLDETSHCSAQPVRYVLEMNQGWFAQRGIGPQAVVEGLTQAISDVRVR